MDNLDIIKLKDANGNEVEIPTMSYIIKQTTIIENVIKEHANDLSAHNSLSKKSEVIFKPEEQIEIKIPKETDSDKKIKAEDILTDKDHQFVTKQQLNRLEKSLTDNNLSAAIDDCAINFRNQLNEDINKILNTHDIIDKLHTIVEILQQENTLDNLINLISSKASQTDLDNHILNKRHITNEDREALKILQNTVRDGINWNEDDEEKIRLINKPKSLPANGGNADTINNTEVSLLTNHQPYGIIVGVGDGLYSKSELTHATTNCFSNEIIKEAKEKKSTIMIRTGCYYINNDIAICDVNIKGENTCSHIYLNDNTLILNNVRIYDINLIDGTIILQEGVMLIGCELIGIDIVFSNAALCQISNCLFKQCTMKMRGFFQYNIINLNKSDKDLFTFFGIKNSGNIIENNQVI